MASLDHFHGRAVQEIVSGDEDWQWAILLEGGGVVKNWDERRTAVPELPVGLGFLITTFSATQTIMKFGTVDPASGTIQSEIDVVLTPTQYSITDPNFAVNEEFPQRNEMVVQEVTSPETQEDEIVPEEETDPGESTADEGDTGASS